MGMDSGMAVEDDRRQDEQRRDTEIDSRRERQTYRCGNHISLILHTVSPNENTFFHPHFHRKDRVHEKAQEGPQNEDR